MLAALTAFTGAAALLVISPGPATLLVVQVAARRGRREAFLASTGNAAGLAVWAAASILGIAALVGASRVAHDGLRIAGGAVLIGLGAHAILTAGREPSGRARSRARGVRAPFASGLVTALTNPKAAIFYVALLPQFVPDGGSVVGWTLAFALIQIALMLSWYAVLAAAVGGAARLVLRRRALARFHRIMGAGFVGLGAVLATEGAADG